MEMAFPERAADVDVDELYAGASRPRQHGRPWLLTNMVASIDGATAVDELSGGLGGPADRIVFRAIRAVSDIIMVGAATARAEDYGPPIVTEQIQQRRVAAGQAPRPRFALVTRSLDLDPNSRIFSVPTEERPIVLTVSSAPEQRRAALAEVAEIVDVGTNDVDPAAALVLLGHRFGASVVLSEGGPSLNGQLVAHGLIDEVCLSLSPNLVGGPSKRIAQGTEAAQPPTAMTPSWALTQDGLFFLRYVVSPADTERR